MPSDIWTPMLKVAVTAIYGDWERRIQKIFTVLRKKKSKTKEQFYNNDFITQYQMHTSECKKYRTIELTMVTYGNRLNATKFAQANNYDLLRALKHLIKTRLYKDSAAKIFVICRTYFLSAEYIFICRIYFWCQQPMVNNLLSIIFTYTKTLVHTLLWYCISWIIILISEW